MKSFNKNCASHSLEEYLPIISVSDKGTFVLTLPGFLQPEQKELEQMLSQVFTKQINTPANLALAQQLSLNWCVSKAKKNGITDKCLCQ